MATVAPLVVNDTTGNPKPIASTDKLGPFTGGTASGEGMTQDQFGANSTQMTPIGTPTFADLTVTNFIDAPSWSHAGAMDVTPTSGNDFNVNIAGIGAYLHLTSSGASGFKVERANTSDAGTAWIHMTNGSIKWSMGAQGDGTENWRAWNNVVGADAYSINSASNVMNIANLTATNAVLTTPNIGTPSSGVLTNCTGLPVAGGGTGQSSYTDGQLLIGNTATGGLNKANLTGTTNQVNVANGAGSVTLSTPQSIATTSTPQFARMGVGVAASAAASALLCVGGNPVQFTGANYAAVVDATNGGALVLSKDASNYAINQYSNAFSAFTFATVEAGTAYTQTLGCKAGNVIVGGLVASSGATRNLILSGGATSPVLGAAKADLVSKAACDTAAADRNEYSINEQGEIERITGCRCRVATDFAKTSSVTLANVTGLTRNVEAGRKYAFRAVLFTTSNTGGGVQVAIAGTCTATHIIYESDVKDSSTLATAGTTRASALATKVGDVTAVAAARITIEGEIVVNAAGTLTVQFAQNASNGSASTVLTGSYFEIMSLG